MVTVEIIDEQIVMFPENTVEEYGLRMKLADIDGNSTDQDIIYNSFHISAEKILEDER